METTVTGIRSNPVATYECNDGHDQVIYDDDSKCPVCEALKEVSELGREVDSLSEELSQVVEERDALADRVESLADEVASLTPYNPY